MTKTDHTKQLAMLRMLEPVVLALRKQGIKARHECPGYIQIQHHEFIYAPSTDHWLWIHTRGSAWTHLVDSGSDAELIANSIVGHISRSAKGG